jgi:isoleucyl-tRNA synthetase
MPGVHSESVHLERFPDAARDWLDDTLKRDWDRLLEVRREVAKALETARAEKLIGSGLEAAVRIANAPEDLPALLGAKREILPTVFIVSRVDLDRAGARASITYDSQDIPGLVIGVDRARGEKVRALLDAERARRREPRASHALRALRSDRHAAEWFRQSALTGPVSGASSRSRPSSSSSTRSPS